MSDYSPDLSIVAAQRPDKPAPPTTTLVGSNLVISWSAPYDQGTAITGYRIYIRESDLTTYSIDWTYCDGSLTEIRDSRTCEIPVLYLHNGYYQLEWGTSVYAKLSAFNANGVSDVSEAGNGG